MINLSILSIHSTKIFIKKMPYGPGLIFAHICTYLFNHGKMLLLTCGRNGSKILQSTPISSPVTDQVKLDELDFHRLVEGEVEQGGSFTPASVNQLICNQSLPRATLVHRSRHLELLGRSMIEVSFSYVLDLTASNQPCAVVHLQCETLPCCLFTFCQPVVVHMRVGSQRCVFFPQDEDTTCWVVGVEGSALKHLRFEWTPTPCDLNCNMSFASGGTYVFFRTKAEKLIT